MIRRDFFKAALAAVVGVFAGRSVAPSVQVTFRDMNPETVILSVGSMKYCSVADAHKAFQVAAMRSGA